jgi:hypothetical protein
MHLVLVCIYKILLSLSRLISKIILVSIPRLRRAAFFVFSLLFSVAFLSHLIIELCSCPSRLKQTSTMMRIDNVVVTWGIKLILWLRVCGSSHLLKHGSSSYKHIRRQTKKKSDASSTWCILKQDKFNWEMLFEKGDFIGAQPHTE